MGADRKMSRKQKRGMRRKKDIKSKIIEDQRKTLIFQCKKGSPVIRNTLRDFNILKRETSVYFKKKNDILPFVDVTPVQFLTEKNNTSLFLCGSHSKKRPDNLTMGRMYDFKLLDMVELGIQDFKALTTNVKITNQYGSKPCILFQGSEFINSEKHKVLKSLFLDFFKGVEIKKINLTGIDHVIVLTSSGEDTLYFRHYAIRMKKMDNSGCNIELIDIGPSMTWKIRRDRFASADLRKLAFRKPQVMMKSKTRNKSIFRNPLGEKIGKIHIKQQPIKEIVLRKFTRKNKKEDKKK